MTQSLERIKVNFSYSGVNAATNTLLCYQKLLVEVPGIGNTTYEQSLFSTPKTTPAGLTRALDPRYAPGFSGSNTPDVAGGCLALDPLTCIGYTGATRTEEQCIRPLTVTEAAGITPLILSNSAAQGIDLVMNGQPAPSGYINFRQGDQAHTFYVPPGVVLMAGDEFYRIRFYQQVQHPTELSQTAILIAAEVLIVYNPSDTDSWSSGVKPNRMLHSGVRHIQWQGYSYKTPMIDLVSTYIPTTDKTVVHTGFSIQSIEVDDLSQISDSTNEAPVLLINILGQAWPDDIALATTLNNAKNAAANSPLSTPAPTLTPTVAGGFHR